MSSKPGIGLLTAAVLGLAVTLPFVDAAAQGASQSAHADAHRSTRTARRVTYPSVGHQVRTLPQNYRTITVKRNTYRYHDGVFYGPGSRGTHVVVRAPLGARIRTLPARHVSFLIGPKRYFYVNLTYYLWDEPRQEYIVVAEPEGAQAAVAAGESVSGEIFVYPSQGQSDERRSRDRYECHLWAVEQTGYDPSVTDSDVESAGDYRRAITACLEGRGYAVK